MIVYILVYVTKLVKLVVDNIKKIALAVRKDI